jgi:putative tryptophan/tyrosine transport system substrate-binding protein
MNRRELVALGGAALLAPTNARAQTPNRIRRIGVLSGIAADDPDASLRIAAFRSGLAAFGWIEGQNIVVEYRWAAGDIDKMGVFAKQLIDLQAEILVAQSTPAVVAFRRDTQTIPIVFVNVVDPIGSGLIASLARPGGNVTGFTNFEPTMGGKWLQFLHEITDRTQRVAVIFNPRTTPYAIFLKTIEAAAPSYGLTIHPTPIHSADELGMVLKDLGEKANTGLVALPDTFISTHRDLFIALSAHHRLPAIYPFRYFATGGGLISYGVETNRVYRQAATYVDRLLKGTSPLELPVQAPTVLELVINLKTAKALDLDVPPLLLARADEVIE